MTKRKQGTTIQLLTVISIYELTCTKCFVTNLLEATFNDGGFLAWFFNRKEMDKKMLMECECGHVLKLIQTPNVATSHKVRADEVKQCGSGKTKSGITPKSIAKSKSTKETSSTGEVNLANQPQ